jgi:hypothetical protein
MSTGIQDFHKGDTKKYVVWVTDDQDPPNPICVDGGTIWMTFKLKDTDTDPGALQVHFSCTDDVNNPVGKCYIVLEAVQTKTLQANTKYYYDIQYVNNTGEVTTVLSGKVKILSEITEAI